MRLKRIKSIDILGNRFSVEYDKAHNGGSFSCGNSTIVIGVRCISKDPLYTKTVVSHELLECILALMGARYEHNRESGRYLFNFDHQTFENAIQLHTEAMNKFYQ